MKKLSNAEVEMKKSVLLNNIHHGNIVNVLQNFIWLYKLVREVLGLKA